MKSLPSLLVIMSLSLVAPLGAASVLIDFGSNSSFRGRSTAGNWNSVSQAYLANLIDSSGTTTTIDFGPESLGSTDSFNGPGYTNQYTGWNFGGDVTQQQAAIDAAAASSDSAIDKTALGALGVGTATFDYYASTAGRFQLQQMTVGQSYDLTFYSSKKFPTNDTSTTIRVYDDSGYSNLLGSVTIFHGSGSTANLNTVGTIAGLTGPSNSNNIFYVEYKGSNGGTGYINAMSITPVPEPRAALLGGLGMLMLLRRRRRA